jgi:hypothetical protein
MNIQVHHERGVYGKLVLRVDWSIDDIIEAARESTLYDFDFGVNPELTSDEAKKLIYRLGRTYDPRKGISVGVIVEQANKIIFERD